MDCFKNSYLKNVFADIVSEAEKENKAIKEGPKKYSSKQLEDMKKLFSAEQYDFNKDPEFRVYRDVVHNRMKIQPALSDRRSRAIEKLKMLQKERSTQMSGAVTETERNKRLAHNTTETMAALKELFGIAMLRKEPGVLSGKGAALSDGEITDYLKKRCDGINIRPGEADRMTKEILKEAAVNPSSIPEKEYRMARNSLNIAVNEQKQTVHTHTVRQ